MAREFPRFAEKLQEVSYGSFPRFGQHPQKQSLILAPMDYREEIGRRIRATREEKGWKLAELSRRTGDILTLKRINAYENGDRMPGPSEAVILAKALGVRPAYIMAVDDIQLPISAQEERLIRNWRTLPERDRMQFFRQVEALAMTYRDSVPDSKLEHLSARGKATERPPATPRARK